MPSLTNRSSSRINPPRMFVSPSFSRMLVVTLRLPNVGRPPKPVPCTLLSSISSASVTSSFACTRGLIEMFTPMFLIGV